MLPSVIGSYTRCEPSDPRYSKHSSDDYRSEALYLPSDGRIASPEAIKGFRWSPLLAVRDDGGVVRLGLLASDRATLMVGVQSTVSAGIAAVGFVQAQCRLLPGRCVTCRARVRACATGGSARGD